MFGTYSFFRYEDRMRLAYSEWQDPSFMLYFDMSSSMFEAVKSEIVTDAFWKWSTGEEVKHEKITFFGDNVCRVETPVEYHYVYFIRNSTSTPFAYIHLEEFLPYTGQRIEDKMDVTSFGRLLSTVHSIHDLPLWT
jgi:hypothetical protein